MKRRPFTFGADSQRTWRSLDEFADSATFREALAAEFPEGAEQPDGVSRRSFVTLMGASLGLAGLTGCRRPEEKILPYTKAPEDVVPGRPMFYATAMPFYGTAVGLLVESHEGRPTKIEGNPKHPDSQGGASAWIQASLLELYDPERVTQPLQGDRPAAPEAAEAAITGAGKGLSDGKRLAIVTTEHRSPTTSGELAKIKSQWAGARILRWEAFSRANARAGGQLAFAKPVEPVYRADKARVLVSLDADFFNHDGSPLKIARGFSRGRKPGADMNRLYVVESGFSITGSMADHRIRMRSAAIGGLAAALCKALDGLGVKVAGSLPAAGVLGPAEQKLVDALARDLALHKGKGLVVAGERQPPAVHALALLVNHALGNIGGPDAPVSLGKPWSDDAEGAEALADLTKALGAGEIDVLVILGGNPVYDAPGDVDFGAAMAKAKVSIHLADSPNETSARASWVVPRAHTLETWSDLVAEDGTTSIVQPLIAPLHGGKTDAEVLSLLRGERRSAHELVTATWDGKLGAKAFGLSWRKALHEGVIEGSVGSFELAPPQPGALALPADAGGLEITFAPDSHAFDGRFANSGWMQEMPDPMSKLTWDNGALVSPETARKLGVAEGDLLSISADGRGSVKVPAVVQPGQADDSIALTLGQGRSKVGKVGKGVGFSVAALRRTGKLGFAAAKVSKSGETHKLARTQEHHNMEGRDLVRTTSLTKRLGGERSGPAHGGGEHGGGHKAHGADHGPVHLPQLFEAPTYTGQRWAMAIDLNSCIGCNACMVGCQAENNIPVVGKTGVLRSREMHWIRIDRYFVGENINDPTVVMQPMTCQQCENAPCESVCPVGATTHSPEGLNDMAYNRCIGTRYCANNCPFKVRRFNYFNYTKNTPELHKMAMNPDVTVRDRGVMEKCTYCVQRINQAKISAHKGGKNVVEDGAITTACQQTCPTAAITFGDLSDPHSRLNALLAEGRDYKLLEEINVRPRTSYLERVRNPNPELG